jgi:hypothetical protein
MGKLAWLQPVDALSAADAAAVLTDLAPKAGPGRMRGRCPIACGDCPWR